MPSRFQTTLILALAVSFTIGIVFSRSWRSKEVSNSGAYIKALYSLPLTLDPVQMDDTASLVVSNLIYDGLLTFTPSLELRSLIAESWSTSRDGKTLHFHLRKDAKFQNGDAITSIDVVRSLMRTVAPNSKVYSYYDCVVGAEEYHKGRANTVSGLVAASETDVEISLKYPFPPFLSVLAGATAKILPQSVTQSDFFKRPIGSGPFRYTQVEKSEKYSDLTLERFDGYYAEKPKLAKLVLRAMDESEALSEAKAGAVDDLVNFPLSGQEDAFSNGQHVTAPVAATWIIGLNSRLAPFNQLAVRRAFRDSIDSEEFRHRFYPDAIPAYGYIPPGLPGFQKSYEAFSQKGTTGTVSKHLIRVAIPQELARVQEMKEFFEKRLRAQGWNVEVVPMEWAKLMKGYADKNLQAFLVSMNMDYPDTEFLVRNFESTNPDNFSGISDRKIDQLIHEARATQDRVVRQNIYTQLVSLLRKAAVTVNLFHPRGHYWLSKCVYGFAPNILADTYIDYRVIGKNCERAAMAGVP